MTINVMKTFGVIVNDVGWLTFNRIYLLFSSSLIRQQKIGK